MRTKKETEAIINMAKSMKPKEYDKFFGTLANNCITFHHFYPIGDYIVDFYLYKKKLAIEIDGLKYKKLYGDISGMDNYLKAQGIKIIHMPACEVFKYDINKIKKIPDIEEGKDIEQGGLF